VLFLIPLQKLKQAPSGGLGAVFTVSELPLVILNIFGGDGEAQSAYVLYILVTDIIRP